MAQMRGQRGKRHGFLHGALVLTAGMAVVKVLGALFKVPLTYAIGEYGIGLFNLAYHFYGPVFTLATAGSRSISGTGGAGAGSGMGSGTGFAA